MGKKLFESQSKINTLESNHPSDGYFHLQQLEWTPDQLQKGIPVKVKEVPFKVQLFKVVATNGGIDWAITNRSSGSIDTQVVRDQNKVRWMIEQLHQELKNWPALKMPMPQATCLTDSYRLLLSNLVLIESES